MKRLAIFASGNGTNAENIIRYFRQHPSEGTVALIITNNSNAPVVGKAGELGVDVLVFSKDVFRSCPEKILGCLESYRISFIALAGFLLLVPEQIIMNFEGRILNIHPSLLPKFGGKGMIGNHVHQAVIDAKEKESGITIHHVSLHYDEGEAIFQAKCRVLPDDTPQSLADRVHQLEYEYYPHIISEELAKIPDL